MMFNFSCWLIVFIALVSFTGAVCYAFVLTCMISIGIHGFVAVARYWSAQRFIRASLKPGAGLVR